MLRYITFTRECLLRAGAIGPSATSFTYEQFEDETGRVGLAGTRPDLMKLLAQWERVLSKKHAKLSKGFLPPSFPPFHHMHFQKHEWSRPLQKQALPHSKQQRADDISKARQWQM
ncbi:hypothetical protein Mapa_008582 [Marchantia paleacea]|nr:hypothetical protein Mapa_008582 [Marchantia paleacea]